MPTNLIGEFGAELAADPPDQAALAHMVGRKNDRELRGHFKKFGDDLDAAVGDIGDRAVARQ